MRQRPGRPSTTSVTATSRHPARRAQTARPHLVDPAASTATAALAAARPASWSSARWSARVASSSARPASQASEPAEGAGVGPAGVRAERGGGEAPRGRRGPLERWRRRGRGSPDLLRSVHRPPRVEANGFRARLAGQPPPGRPADRPRARRLPADRRRARARRRRSPPRTSRPCSPPATGHAPRPRPPRPRPRVRRGGHPARGRVDAVIVGLAFMAGDAA